MKIFIDTSSLSKLYHHEKGTNELEQLFTTFSIDAIFLAEITKIEFATAVSLKQKAEVFITADKLLQDLFKIENLPMQIFH